jgi:hypothetical protein
LQCVGGILGVSHNAQSDRPQSILVPGHEDSKRAGISSTRAKQRGGLLADRRLCHRRSSQNLDLVDAAAIARSLLRQRGQVQDISGRDILCRSQRRRSAAFDAVATVRQSLSELIGGVVV